MKKDLKNYSEDIYKCTKCGFCQSVCPIFEETGLECAVSRGRFSLLQGVIQKELNFSPKISKYLDMCLGCNACSGFCPSGINAEEIIMTARAESFKLKHTSFIKKFAVSIFNSRFKLIIIKFLVFLYRKLGFIAISKVFTYIIPFLKKYIKLFNALVTPHVKYKKRKSPKNKSGLKVVYFPGCINNNINSGVKNAVRMVLEYNGIKPVIPSFNCCGIPARSIGDFDSFIKLAKKNLDKINTDIDYLLTDCATCGSVWDLYAQVLDGEYKQKAEILAKKAININKFLIKINFSIPDKTMLNKTVTYHDPCHLKRTQGIFNEPREILKRLPGIKLIEMKDADKCCGASGTFCIANPELSSKISSKKAQNIIETGAEAVVTSCPSCNIGIMQGLIQKNELKSVYQPIELIAESF